MTNGAWHKDPTNRFQYRWWDGQQWTDQAFNEGQQAISDPLQQPAPVRQQAIQQQAPVQQTYVPTTGHSQQNVQKMVSKTTTNTYETGGGTIFTEPILVVSQKAKLIEVKSEYAIYNQDGKQLGAVREVGQSAFKKVLRFFSKLDSLFAHKFEIIDFNGNVLINIVRPRTYFKSKFQVSTPNGHVGEIAQKNIFGKIRFSFTVNQQDIGSLNAENWRAWNFNVQDVNGNQIARVTKKYSGLGSLFTTADNYVVEIPTAPESTLHIMTLASALIIDTALKQTDH